MLMKKYELIKGNLLKINVNLFDFLVFIKKIQQQIMQRCIRYYNNHFKSSSRLEFYVYLISFSTCSSWACPLHVRLGHVLQYQGLLKGLVTVSVNSYTFNKVLI